MWRLPHTSAIPVPPHRYYLPIHLLSIHLAAYLGHHFFIPIWFGWYNTLTLYSQFFIFVFIVFENIFTDKTYCKFITKYITWWCIVEHYILQKKLVRMICDSNGINRCLPISNTFYAQKLMSRMTYNLILCVGVMMYWYRCRVLVTFCSIHNVVGMQQRMNVSYNFTENIPYFYKLQKYLWEYLAKQFLYHLNLIY